MTVREEIVEAALHRGGMKMMPCLALDPIWFAAIQRDVAKLMASKPSSNVSEKSHPTNWTNPYGQVTQHSLWNESGSTADTTTDHNLKIEGKLFTALDCDALRRFFSAFEKGALNFRLNGMAPHSGLSPHEENVIHEEKIRVRFHLPVFTNNKVRAMLDGEKFHMRAGYIYYFNNGCVHAADNDGERMRYHLLWDMWLDEWTEDKLFNPDSPATPAEGMRKLSREERTTLSQSEPWIIDEYVNYCGEVVKMPRNSASV